MPNENSSNEPPGNPKNISPPVEEAPMADGSHCNACTDKKKPEDLAQQVHWIQHATFWNQVGLGIIGIGALLIYFCQLKAMQGQLTEMQGSGHQTDQLIHLYGQQVDQNTALVTATEDSVKVARDALAKSTQLFNKEQRPWLGVNDITVGKFGENLDYIMNLVMVNSGKTPMRRAWYWGQSVSSAKPGPNYAQMDDGRHLYLGAIAPQGSRVIRIYWRWNKEWHMAYPDVAGHKTIVTNYGVIHYFDSAGSEHTTQFCVYLADVNLPTQRPLFCDNFNGMD